jgi:hypothetical protein
MSNFKFQNINKDIANATIQKELLKNREKNINLHDNSHITIGGLFNVDAFNKKLDKIFSNIQQRQKIEETIKELKVKSTIPNPDKMTLNQFISGITADTYDMFYELFTINVYSKSNINKIMDKNYRRITLYIILLILLIIIYYILSIKSYFFSDVLNNK